MSSESKEPVEPVQDRICKDVVCAPIVPMSLQTLLDPKSGLPRLSVLKEHLQKEGRLTVEAILHLVNATQKIYAKEANLLELSYPITVCGDIHGQFFDLMQLFEVGGDPADTQYLFLGDYVDRGCFSTEVVIYLYAMKMTYPNSFFMLRGNHECRLLTDHFNFKDECVYKYNIDVYNAIMVSFDHLPLGALVNQVFLCVHGGLSPDINSLDDIRALDRFHEIPRDGPMCDLLWSDPFEDANGDNSDSWFGYNETRQCSFNFGIEAVKQFLDECKLTSIIRAHEAQVDGFKMHMLNKETNIPRVITIFSAPNYCDVYKNKAACLKFDHTILNIKQFNESPHPYYLPNFMDVFQWSLPFVADKVTDMLLSIMHLQTEAEEGHGEEHKDHHILEKRGGLLKKKVQAVTKMLRMYKVLRQESESVAQLKALTPNHLLPHGVLQAGASGIKQALVQFQQAFVKDKVNESQPGSVSVNQDNIPDDLRKNKRRFSLKRDSLSEADSSKFMAQAQSMVDASNEKRQSMDRRSSEKRDSISKIIVQETDGSSTHL